MRIASIATTELIVDDGVTELPKSSAELPDTNSHAELSASLETLAETDGTTKAMAWTPDAISSTAILSSSSSDYAVTTTTSTITSATSSTITNESTISTTTAPSIASMTTKSNKVI